MAREMGTTTAPVVGSGSCPAKMARVPNPQVAALPQKKKRVSPSVGVATTAEVPRQQRWGGAGVQALDVLFSIAVVVGGLLLLLLG